MITLFVLLTPLSILNSIFSCLVKKRLLSVFISSASSPCWCTAGVYPSLWPPTLSFPKNFYPPVAVLQSGGLSHHVSVIHTRSTLAATHGLLTRAVCSPHCVHLCTGIVAEAQAVLLLQGKCAVPQSHSL